MVFGQRDYRFDVPKSKITFVGRNVILGMEWDELSNIKLIRIRLCLQENLLTFLLKRRMFFTGCVRSKTNDTTDTPTF